MMSLVATGGGLVFGGDANGRFKALDDKTGKVLWELNLGSPVSGYPIAFAVDGKQYVAAITGPSLAANSDERLAPELSAGQRAERVRLRAALMSGSTSGLHSSAVFGRIVIRSA